MASYRACTACRIQKLRCIPDDTEADRCQRCVRLGRDCVFGSMPTRKQRKRTDARVAELEEEMRAMRALLNSQVTTTAVPTDPVHTPDEIGLGSKSFHTALRSSGREMQTRQQAVEPLQSSGGDGLDVIDRDLLSMATARHLFETYRRDLFPHYPMVYIAPSVSADEMRQSKPTLFLAIIAAAAGKDYPELSATLDQEVLQRYATKSLMQSEKSLELVQAFLISAIWYHPPSKFIQLKYYEYIHMAATMAMDIGIGSRPIPGRNQPVTSSRLTIQQAEQVHHLEDATNPDLSMTPRLISCTPDTASIESRRTFVSCFSICTGVSLSVRRPNILRATSYLKQCLEYIESSSEAIPSDVTLVAWVRLMMIANDINDCLQYDDPGNMASIADLRTHFILRDLNRRLDDWRSSVSPRNLTASLTITYWTTRLYLHEVALHIEHSPEDFKAPYQMGTIHVWEGDEIPTQVLAESIAECINCSHNLINTFLGIDVVSARALPVLSYVRVSFAAFMLAKLCLSASHPRSLIGRVLDRESLKATDTLDRAILHVRTIVGSTRCRVPTIFLALLFKLRQWCLDPTLIERPRILPGANKESGRGERNLGTEGSQTAEKADGGHGAAGSMPQIWESSRGGASAAAVPPGLFGSNTAMDLDQDLFAFLQDVDAFDTDAIFNLNGAATMHAPFEFEEGVK